MYSSEREFIGLKAKYKDINAKYVAVKRSNNKRDYYLSVR